MLPIPVAISERLRSQIRSQRLIVLIGAGVSAGAPTRLPGWIKINQMIFEAVCDRVEAYLNREPHESDQRSLADVRSAVDDRRGCNQFPPDYQAQILEENAGQVYFQALQVLDSEVRNAAHDALAHLARHRVLAAIVTTNFDQLIERALAAAGVTPLIAFDDRGYSAVEMELLLGGERLPLLKVHGCVSDDRSLVDTLKQRLQGRNWRLDRCLDQLLARHPCVFAGFSADDLESDDEYLRILPSAPASPGIAYVRWPGEKELRPGAARLLTRYGRKAEEIVAEASDVFDALGRAANAPPRPAWETKTAVDTDAAVRSRLASWAESLHPAAAANCTAAVLESNGLTGDAFRTVDLFLARAHEQHRAGEHYERLRRTHGRLGVGYGRVSVRTDNGTGVQRSMEDLIRQMNDGDALAAAWGGVAFVWAGAKEHSAHMLQHVFLKGSAQHRVDEVNVDCWLAMAEALYFYAEPEWVLNSSSATMVLADLAADLPRKARCAGITALFHAMYLPDAFQDYMTTTADPVLKRAARLNDPSIEGFRNLAQGLYLRSIGNAPSADEWVARMPMSAETLRVARTQLLNAGRMPWAVYASMEYAKSLACGGRMPEAAVVLNAIADGGILDRSPILRPWHAEASGMYYARVPDPARAREAYTRAIEYAEAFPIPRLVESLHVRLKTTEAGPR